MDKGKIISFIVPAYNSERYLKKALDSFYVPELAEYMEVIIVDDGSTDKTAEIAQGYAAKWPVIYRLIQKENGGHGSVINLGSKEASGKYFKVIDADDWIMTENLTEYIRYLTASDAEIILTPFHMVDMNSGERTVQKMYAENYDRIYSPNELADNWKAFDRCTTFHGITYNTSFYNQYRHELPEKIFYEDQEYATIPFCYAKKVALLNLYIYQYLIGNSEQSISNANKIKRIGHLDIVIDHMLDYWKIHQGTPYFANNYFLRKMEGVVLSYYVTMCIVNLQKAQGYKACKLLNHRIKKIWPMLFRKLQKMYFAYRIFGMLNINEKSYEKIIHSKLFRLIWHNHMVEKL